MDHPLIFTAPMVRAILEGRKTMTRRKGKRFHKWQIGDLIWVRETFRELGNGEFCYRADDVGDGSAPWRWSPSIFMPRRASRISLELTGIRRELLLDITDDNVNQEGFSNISDFLDYFDKVAPGVAQFNPGVVVLSFTRIRNEEDEYHK